MAMKFWSRFCVSVSVNLLLKLACILLLVNPAKCRKLPDIFWNSTNSMFDLSNTDHVKSVRILDRVTVICPLPDDSRSYEYSKLYMVSQEDYENCQLHSEQLLGSCVTPERHSSISLVFRDFSPLPSALEFQPGQSYYVISTSNGSRSGVDNRVGGLCSRFHMKMRFDVLPDDASRSANEPPTFPGKNNHQASLESTGNSDSPLMYIIHTVDPETVPSAVRSAQSADKDEPDSAPTCSFSVTLLLACFLLTLDVRFRLL